MGIIWYNIFSNFVHETKFRDVEFPFVALCESGSKSFRLGIWKLVMFKKSKFIQGHEKNMR